MSEPGQGPTTRLWVVRHGDSPRFRLAPATAAGSPPWSDQDEPRPRDADAPLSAEGAEQARALGRRLAAAGHRPDAVWCSPYVRCRQTVALVLAELATSAATWPEPQVHFDERLRDREPGVRDLLPRSEFLARYPHEAVRWGWLGKFYHRPPGGESGADVVLRVRSLLRDLLADGGPDVLVVGHDVVVHAVRYVLERMDEDGYLALRAESVPHASLTTLVRRSTGWVMTGVDDTDHLAGDG